MSIHTVENRNFVYLNLRDFSKL